VAVDRKLVRHRQHAALAADVGQLLLVAEGNGGGRNVGAGHGVPASAVGVVVRFGRIDKVVPEFVKGFKEAAVEGGSGHGGTSGKWEGAGGKKYEIRSSKYETDRKS